jgi:hypothetical protein
MKPFRLVSSVYIPSYILHSLGCAVEGGDLTKVIAQFLLDQMDEGNRGIWRFFGRSRSSPPPDFDDTCCVLASLKESQIAVESKVWAHLSEQTSAKDLHYTWIDDVANSRSGHYVDIVVNANILFFAALSRKRKMEIVRFINSMSSDIPYRLLSPFSVSEHATIYLITRAYRDGGVRELEPAVTNVARYLLERQRADGSWGNASDTVLSLVALLNAGIKGRPLRRSMEYLFRVQEPSGAFGSYPFFKDFRRTYYSSPYLTAALFLEAASKLQSAKG